MLVDISVWSLTFRRDSDGSSAEVFALCQALEAGDIVVTAGLMLQVLQQGFSWPRASKGLIDRFSALPFLSPNRQNPIDIAELRNKCRRSGVQAGTIDALLAQLCVRHGLTLLTTEKDFAYIALHCPLVL